MNYPINTSSRSWDNWLKQFFFPLLLTGIFVNITGLFITILEPDGALYAAIAKTMAQANDFINLKVDGKDWLDKPHFPFWITALSYKIFGITTFAYKFPALLFWAAGAIYTYLLAGGAYGRAHAQLSVLVYMVAAHLFISNNDVRAEPYLTGLIAGSIYHLYKVNKKATAADIIAGSLLAACAVMTKGIFILLVIAAGFVMHWIVTRDLKQLFKGKWWLVTILTLIFILPELYCLYRQFDLHPEKTVFGQQAVSGLRFFFWDSQFGRFFNTGPIKGSGDPFFYFHTVLWAFLPWSLLLYAAIIWRFRRFNNRRVNPEYITLFTIIATFLLFSLSRFQLPHYINIIFPFFSICCAHFLLSANSSRMALLVTWLQRITCVLLPLVAVALCIFSHFPGYIFFIVVLGLLLVFIFFGLKSENIQSIFTKTFMTATIVYCYLNISFYPSLLHYQSGSEIAFYLNKTWPGKPVTKYYADSYSLAFYTNAPVLYGEDTMLKEQARRGPVLVFTQQPGIDSLKAAGFNGKIIKTFPHFHISQLTLPFINYKTRSEQLGNFMIVEVNLP